MSVDVLTLDLTEAEARDRLHELERVDILVNNAGAISGGDLQTVQSETGADRATSDFTSIDLCRRFYSK